MSQGPNVTAVFELKTFDDYGSRQTGLVHSALAFKQVTDSPAVGQSVGRSVHQFGLD